MGVLSLVGKSVAGMNSDSFKLGRDKDVWVFYTFGPCHYEGLSMTVLVALGIEVDWQDDHLHEIEDLFVRLEKVDQARGLESPKKRWSRIKIQRKLDKDPLVLFVFGS
nr:hypothetical protein [Tanacetum cinerariifolium]